MTRMFCRSVLVCAIWLFNSLTFSQELRPKPDAVVEAPLYYTLGADEGDEKFDAQLRFALAQQIDLKYANTPLKEVAEDLTKKLGIPVVLNDRDLDEVGETPDTPFTLALSKVNARAAIQFFLSSHGLCIMPQDRRIVITNPDRASTPENSIRRLYPVADLLPKKRTPWSESGDRDFDSLIELLTCSIAPNSWPDVGGPGNIDPVGDAAILIEQTIEVHWQIEKLLTALRRCQREFAANPNVATTPMIDIYGRDRIRQALEKNDTYRFNGTLAELAEIMTATIGHPVILSQRDLDEVGITSDSRVAGSYSNVPIRIGLRSLLRPLGLTYRVCDFGIEITNPDAACKPENLETMIVPIWGLPHFDRLEGVIRRASDPSVWSENGGAGHIQFYAEPPLLLVSHRSEVTETIPATLAQLRKLEGWRKQLPGELTTPEYVQRVFSLTTTIQEHIPASSGNVQVVRKEVKLTEAKMQKLLALIKRNIAPVSWKGSDVKLDGWENQLLIRNKPAVVAEVRQLLQKMGNLAEVPAWQIQP